MQNKRDKSKRDIEFVNVTSTTQFILGVFAKEVPVDHRYLCGGCCVELDVDNKVGIKWLKHLLCRYLPQLHLQSLLETYLNRVQFLSFLFGNNSYWKSGLRAALHNMGNISKGWTKTSPAAATTTL